MANDIQAQIEALQKLADQQAAESKSKNKVGFKAGRVYGKVGGIEGFNSKVANFSDSGVFLFDKAEERTTKTGENKGRKWFRADSTDGGHPGGFDLEECVAKELEYKGNLNLVGGTPGKDENGIEFIEDAYLILGRGIRGQKVGGALQIVTA